MLIEPTTAAVAKSVQLKAFQSISVRGSLSTDVIAIEIPDGAGGWKSLTEDGNLITLTSSNEQITASGNTLIRVNKPTTTNAVGVAIL